MTDISPEEKTFRKLKQTPFEDMGPLMMQAVRSFHAPMISFPNGSVFESKKHELVYHYQRLKCLEENGWTLEEFVLEAEKRNIVKAIEQYNLDNAFPMELVERAKEFFPNARFTPAKIELE